MFKKFSEWVLEREGEVLEEGVKAKGKKKKKNWIQGAVKHPGRCTPAPNADCPKGSPQYNLAMRFKRGDLKKKKKKS